MRKKILLEEASIKELVEELKRRVGEGGDLGNLGDDLVVHREDGPVIAESGTTEGIYSSNALWQGRTSTYASGRKEIQKVLVRRTDAPHPEVVKAIVNSDPELSKKVEKVEKFDHKGEQREPRTDELDALCERIMRSSLNVKGDFPTAEDLFGRLKELRGQGVIVSVEDDGNMKRTITYLVEGDTKNTITFGTLQNRRSVLSKKIRKYANHDFR